MRISNKWLSASTLLVATVACLRAAETLETDLCVFGGTSAGVVAAVQARKMGKTVALVEPGVRLGGLTSGGLGATDIGNKAAIGGLSREFYHRIAQHYAREQAWKYETAADYFRKKSSGQAKDSQLTGEGATMWTFEPAVAERIFQEMLTEAGVVPHLRQRLVSVRRLGARVTEITMESGDVFRAKMFIDCTYEGDLMAKAGISCTVGREANAKYGETLNGIRAETPHHQFLVPVDPYLKPGDAASGLLPFIQPGDGGKPGEGDQKVQAYNYRLCFTTNAANRGSVTPPPDYDPGRYELLARYLEALVAAGKPPRMAQFWNPIWMPNQKTDINNNGGFSTDYIGMNYAYAEADYAARDRMAREHENYIRGFLTFLATNPRVPESLRAEVRLWGPAKDEFSDTGGWPYALYVREARRMVAAYVMTEKNCRHQEVVEDSVGLAAYNMDSHNIQRLVKKGRVENEGDVQVAPTKPYPISFHAIVPKATECENVLVPVCLSASHIAYGSIRMEPVFMILAQSAVTAACQALDESVAVQRLDYGKLRARLLADRQILSWPESGAPGEAIEEKKLPGITVDDVLARKVGTWAPSTLVRACLLGKGYVHDDNANKGQASIVFTPEILAAAEYEIFLLAPPHANRATHVPVTVSVAGAVPRRLIVNQRDPAPGGFLSLGRYQLPAGQPVAIAVSNQGTEGYVVADGVQLRPTK